MMSCPCAGRQPGRPAHQGPDTGRRGEPPCPALYCRIRLAPGPAASAAASRHACLAGLPSPGDGPRCGGAEPGAQRLAWLSRAAALRQAVCAAGVCGVAQANTHFLDMPFYRTGARPLSHSRAPRRPPGAARKAGDGAAARAAAGAPPPRARAARRLVARAAASPPEVRSRSNRATHCPHFIHGHNKAGQAACRLGVQQAGGHVGGRNGGGRQARRRRHVGTVGTVGTVEKRPLGEADVRIIVDLLQCLRPRQLYAAGDLSDPHGTHRTCLQARPRQRRTSRCRPLA